MRVLFYAYWEPSAAAPFGEDGRGGPTLVECDRDASGVLWIGHHSHAGATEGDQPGQWRHRSGLTKAQIDTLHADATAAAAGTGMTALAAKSMLAGIWGEDARSTMRDLRQVLGSALRTDLEKSIAQLALAFIVKDHIP